MNCTVFSCAGKDAVILSEQFGLNQICITNGICKCAIPVVKIDKFFKILVARKVSVVLYEYYSKNDKKDKLQRVLLRVMLHNRWIDEKKFEIAMDMIYEIGKIIGGLIKYYIKKYKK